MSETDPLDRQPLWCLVGPTASGKTALALDLCEELGAEVLSLDSMLVYRGLDVGTAKPSKAEQARVPHHLMDLAGPEEEFNVQQWRTAALEVLERLAERDEVVLAGVGRGDRPVQVAPLLAVGLR
ncbi:MAG: AAA family ATPase, partial [bacterium]